MIVKIMMIRTIIKSECNRDDEDENNDNESDNEN